MNCWRTLLLLCLVQLVSYVYLRDDENLSQVQNVDQNNYVMDFIEIVTRHGYPAEEHNVTTKDGYNLKLHRIPGSPLSAVTEGKPIVFLYHGWEGSSEIFVLFKQQSIGLMLADAGYDVWLGNARGNVYARSHQTLSPEEPRFWNFSLHEIGIMDLSAMIDYTLENTGEPCLTYIGHSMGGTVVYILLSTLPEYNDKIKLVMGWGTPAFWKTQNLVRSIFRDVGLLLQSLFDPTGMSEASLQNNVLINFLQVLKKNGVGDIFFMLLDFSMGKDRTQLDTNQLLQALLYYPSGTSFKALWHYRQAAASGKFQQYDYENKEENLKHYGQIEPPDYNVSNIVAPLVIFYGQNDPLYTGDDAKEMARRVGANVKIEKIPWRKFNHVDFVLAKDVKKLLYNRVIEVIKEYEDVDCTLNNVKSKS